MTYQLRIKPGSNNINFIFTPVIEIFLTQFFPRPVLRKHFLNRQWRVFKAYATFCYLFVFRLLKSSEYFWSLTSGVKVRPGNLKYTRHKPFTLADKDVSTVTSNTMLILLAGMSMAATMGDKMPCTAKERPTILYKIERIKLAVTMRFPDFA